MIPRKQTGTTCLPLHRNAGICSTIRAARACKRGLQVFHDTTGDFRTRKLRQTIVTRRKQARQLALLANKACGRKPELKWNRVASQRHFFRRCQQRPDHAKLVYSPTLAASAANEIVSISVSRNYLLTTGCLSVIDVCGTGTLLNSEMPRSVTTEIFLHNFPRVTCWIMHISGGPLQRSRVACKPRTAFPRCALKVKPVLRPWRKQLAWTPPLRNNAVLQLFRDAALCSKKEWVVQATKPLFPFKQ